MCGRLKIPLKVKVIPSFERRNKLNINVFELNGTVLTPIHIHTNYDYPQIDLLLYENHYCRITKLHCLINNDSHMKHVCRRCLTAFSSIDILYQHTERCIKQQPPKISSSWKNQVKFEDHYMKIPLPIEVYADFECFDQPQNDTEDLFKQIPFAGGCYLLSPFGNYYYSSFDEGCVSWFVKEMLTLEKITSDCYKTNIPLQITPQE